MITCNKCGFGHKTVEELRACKSWAEMQAEAPAPAQPEAEQSPAVKKAMARFWKRLHEVKPAQPAPPAEPSAQTVWPPKYWQCPRDESHPLEFYPRWQSQRMRCKVCEMPAVLGHSPVRKAAAAPSPAISEEEVAQRATDSIAMRTADWFTGDSANRKDAIFALVKQDVEAAIREVSGPLRKQLAEANAMIQQYKFAVVKAERQLELCREKYDAAMSYANGRWSEWGERAGTVADLLDELGAALQPGQKGGKG